MNPTFYSENDFRLYHHGIKGQKWGVRRYQNPDGSLTEEGRKRYSKLKGNDNLAYRSPKERKKFVKLYGEYSKLVDDAATQYYKDNPNRAKKIGAAGRQFEEAYNAYYWNRFGSNSEEGRLLDSYHQLTEKRFDHELNKDMDEVKKKFGEMSDLQNIIFYDSFSRAAAHDRTSANLPKYDKLFAEYADKPLDDNYYKAYRNDLEKARKELAKAERAGE